MEFETLYLKRFNEVKLATENYIKTRLIDSVEIGLEFVNISNELLEDHIDKFSTDKFNCFQPYTDLIYTFEKHKKNYSKNSYENSLKRDVKPLFETLEIKEDSFEQLIMDLATYYSETNIYRIFRNQHSLYNLIYKSEDFSKFEIQEYETEIENTEVFNYYKKIVYPENKAVNKKSKTLKDITQLSENNFSSIENSLLLYIFISIMKNNGFDTNAELYKTLSLIKIKPHFDFENNDSYRSSLEYKAISGKVNDIDLNNISSNHKFQLKEFKDQLNELKLKIKPFKLKNINIKIEELKSNILTQIT
ncbi:hypothetical protein [Flavobacterium sp.]|jgi:hypothetical protein|uniref:hypothetical protein n=1 Tax=Flavobacterium sp. TaxID=239 RepID=UPI002A82217F|nr:hypothetical protein [Flavobacterium sp.]